MKHEVHIYDDEWYPVYYLSTHDWLYHHPDDKAEITHEELLTAMIYDNLRADANEYIKGLCPKSS